MPTSGYPAPSSAARIAATWPSIIPLGATTMRAGIGLGHRDRGRIAAAWRRCPRRRSRGEQAAVPVIGVLVQAQVGHEHGGVAHLGGAGRRRASWEMPAGSSAAEPPRVLGRGHAEQDQPAHPGAYRFGGGLAQAVPGVLDHARHRADRLRLAEPFLDEHRQDQVGWDGPRSARPGAAQGRGAGAAGRRERRALTGNARARLTGSGAARRRAAFAGAARTGLRSGSPRPQAAAGPRRARPGRRPAPPSTAWAP